MPIRKDLTGKRSGKLIVIKETTRDKHGKMLWLCKCECGNEKEVRGDQLTSGRARSCGCLLKEIQRTGGEAMR